MTTKFMNWMKFTKIYFGLSGLLIFIGLSVILMNGLKLGTDFTGGIVAEYKFDPEVSRESIETKLKEKEIRFSSIQSSEGGSYILKFSNEAVSNKSILTSAVSEISENFEELRYESVGPSIGPELIKKTLYAIAISAFCILLWVAFQFKNLTFGGAAVLAMLHDTLIMVGGFSILGKLFGAEIDFLFATALLTTLAFSVHDTIVVFDRIRETRRKDGGSIFVIANKAISETMVRSINNSLTIIFMLVALILLGGESTRWFAVALLIGTISGTYSSPFIAVPLVVLFENWKERVKKK